MEQADKFTRLGMPGPLAKEVASAVSGEVTTSIDWANVTNKPATFAPTIGTTATTAKAGNYAPAWTDVTGKPTTFTPPAATTSVTGGVKQMPAIANLAAAPTQADFNNLLAALRTAGILAAS